MGGRGWSPSLVDEGLLRKEKRLLRVDGGLRVAVGPTNERLLRVEKWALLIRVKDDLPGESGAALFSDVGVFGSSKLSGADPSMSMAASYEVDRWRRAEGIQALPPASPLPPMKSGGALAGSFSTSATVAATLLSLSPTKSGGA